MNLKAVWKTIAPIQIMLGAAMVLTSLISIYYQESPWPLVIWGLSALIFGHFLLYLCRGINLQQTLRTKEGFAMTTFSWIFAALFGAIPFYLSNFPDLLQLSSFTDSFFEAMSGFTTTGSSILTNIEQFPKGILFWRSLTHWFGGMGIIVIALAIFPQLAIGWMQMYQSEAPWPFKKDKLVPRIKNTAKILWKVYLIFTVIEFIALSLTGLGWFDALTHTFGTIATGGFSPYNNSITGLHNGAAEIVIAIFMILAGVNFSLYFSFFNKRSKGVFDRELMVYLSLLILVFGLIVWNLYSSGVYASLLETMRVSFFQVPAILTTTGYTTANFDTWPPLSKGLILMMMFIGGSAGSTAGGFKIIRHIVLFKYVTSELKRKLNSHIVNSIKIANRAIDTSILNSIIAFAGAYFGLFFLGGIALTFFGLNLTTAFSASIANLGNIGPGFDLISPIGNYGFMPNGAKWILCFLMLAGRLEVFTVLILFLPETWKKGRKWRI